MKLAFIGKPLYHHKFVWSEPEDADILFVRFDRDPPKPLPATVKVVCTNMSDPLWDDGSLGVPVITTKDIELRDVTPTIEHTWGLIHAAHRRITAVATDPFGHRDNWIVPNSIKNSVITIFGGNGRIGSAVARVANAFQSSAFVVEATYPDEDNVKAILCNTDILVCCISRNKVNPVITAEMLDTLQYGAIVVNTSYGEAIDFRHLLTCISRGSISCAALDVIPPDARKDLELPILNLIKAGLLIVTPHIAGSTKDMRILTEKRVITKAVEVYIYQ